LLAGIHPKVVSERLGHANITITLDTYSHVLPNMQQEAISKLEELLAVKPVATALMVHLGETERVSN
jgi:integrase